MCGRVLVIVFGIYLIVQLANSKGIVEWKFVKYSNNGDGSNGNCCDGAWFVCPSACDHYFKICLDTESGKDNDFSNCPFGKKTSSQIVDQNVITFQKNFGGLENPMKFKFSQSWPGGLKMKVQVVDNDDNAHDHVDDLVKIYTATPIIYSKAESNVVADQGWTQFTVKGNRANDKTTLESEIRVYCDENYYNPYCDAYCKPGNSSSDGFYTCDPKTGKRICRKGWEGTYCRQASDPCVVDPCKDYQICTKTGQVTRECVCPEGKIGNFCNETEVCTNTTCGEGGMCSFINGSVTCFCSNYWTGRYCETKIDPCDTVICQNNGSCDSNITEDFKCICNDGWTGKFCETEYEPCKECLNNSTCGRFGNGTGNITCTCLEGWTGEFCETEYTYDECSVCLNNATCTLSNNGTQNVTCTCLEGWTGEFCETKYDPCAQCLNNNTCISGNGTGNITCTCLEGWTGSYCETQYNTCDSSPCLNNGTCNSIGFSYNCSCSDDFTGIHCEIMINFTSPVTENDTVTVVPVTPTSTPNPTSSTPITITTPKTSPVAITFVGLVKDDRKLAQEFEKLVYDLTGAKDKIKIVYDKKYLKSKEGDTLTSVSFRVLERDTDITDKLDRVLSDTDPDTVDQYFSMKIYRDYDKDIKPEKLKGEQHTGWIHQFWYIVLIVILAFIVLFVLVAVLVAKYRKRKNVLPGQKDVIARESSNISEAAPAQSFENSLYFEMNQPIKKEPKTSTSSE